MQRIDGVNRKRCVSVVCFVGLMGAMSVAPGSAFAQAAKNAAEPSSGKTVSNSANDSASPEKLIVGAWRGGRDSEEKNVVFNQDGTYEDLGANLFCEEHDVSEGGRDFKEQAFVRSQGKWQVKDGRLVLTNNDRMAFWDQAPRRDNGDRAKSTCRFDILRSADGFLRLRLVPNQTTQRGTFFFHRTEEKPIEKEFANVPPEYRRVLAAAELTPDEAVSFADWLKAQKLDSPAQLEVIDRLAQARRHKITLVQLFGMTADEAAAFREVAQQANGEYQRLTRLAACDQLTAIERQAIDKVKSVVTDLNRVTDQLPMDMQSRSSVRGPGGMEISQQIAQESLNRGFAAGGGNFGGGFGGGGAGVQLVVGPDGGLVAQQAGGGGRRGGGGGFGSSAGGFGGRRGGRGFIQLAPNAESLDETQREAVVKLNAYMADLGNWFWRSLFPTE